MKKKFAAGLLLFLVVGCGNSGEAPTAMPEPDAEIVESGSQLENGDLGETPEEEPSQQPEVEANAEEPVDQAGEDELDFGEPIMSDRGLLVKKVGQAAGFTDEEGNSTVTLVLTEMQLNPKCTAEYPEKPENGHYLALHFTVETFPDLADFGGSFDISDFDFRVWDEDGSRVNDASAWGSCLPHREMLPSNFGPSDKASGWLLLDVPTESGTVAFMPYGAGEGGWEREY